MRKLLSLFMLGLTLAVVGCEKEDNKAPSAPVATGGGKLKIVFIPKSSGISYFNAVGTGLEDACKNLKGDFTTSAPAKADATSQIPIVKDQIQRGVDVIVVSANAVDTLNEVFDEAKAKGITVMTVDSDITGNETHRDAGIQSPDPKEVGASQIELLGSLMGYEGPFAIVSATTDAPNQNAWIAAMKDTLKLAKYQKMKLVDIVYGNDDEQKSTTVSEALLSNHPDLRGIIAPTTVGLKGAAQALKVAGAYPGGPHAVGKGIELIGLAGPSDTKGYINDGVVASTQLWSPRDMGFVTAYVAQAIRSGKVKPTLGSSVDVPGMGKRTFVQNGVLVAGPMVTYNKSNVDK